MWKAPNRPTHEITQSYNDGAVTVYSVTDKAEPGNKPTINLTECVTLHYAEQRLGITRYYAAAQAMSQVERVIRVPRHQAVNAQMMAITEDGKKYRIDLVQAVDDVYPPSLDLTLSKVTHDAEVAHDAMV